MVGIIKSRSQLAIEIATQLADNTDLDISPSLLRGVLNDVLGSAGGSLNWLNTLTAATSASLDDTTSITSIYDDYMFVLDNLVPASTAGIYARLRNSGSFQSTNYLNSAGGVTSAIDLTGGVAVANTAGYGLSGVIFLHNANASSGVKWVDGRIHLYTGAVVAGPCCGIWTTAAAINGIQFLGAGGVNLSTGSVKVFGLAKE